MVKARDIKNAIEKMIADGFERMVIVNRVIEMGVEAELADFLVGTYSRKFNK